MTNLNDSNILIDPIYKYYRPWISAFVFLLCIILFIGINTESNNNTWEILKKWGAPSSYEIWNGNYWGLITSNFLHKDFWHIAFNLYWFWIFGKKIEFESTKLFYVFLLFSSAFVCSTFELIFSSNTGIGLSGIGYTLFGYILIMGRFQREYSGFIEKRTIYLFIIWLFGCIILTYLKILEVGNGAHFGGFLWGLLMGQLSQFKKNIKILIPIIILLILSISLFWEPWSVEWLSNRAYNLQINNKIKDAEEIYHEILKKQPYNEIATQNLKGIELDKLKEIAYTLHKKHKYSEALIKYKQVLKIDSTDTWAKKNMEMINNR